MFVPVGLPRTEEHTVDRFDGVALIAVGGTDDASRAAGRRALVDRVARTAHLRLADGRIVGVRRPFGFPATLPTDAGHRGGEAVVVVGLLAASPPRGSPDGHAPRGSHGGHVPSLGGLGQLAAPTATGWWVEDLAVVPPVRITDLVACRPLAGGGVHAALVGHAMTLCGRLPVRGDLVAPGAVDCRRCLDSEEVSARHDRQLAQHGALVELVGPLAAGVADRLWQRLGHRDAAEVPALLDAMVGAITLRVPGAPSTDTTLAHIRRHRTVASEPVRRWAAAEARERLTRGLIRSVATHPVLLDRDTQERLDLAADLVDPAQTAEVVIDVLDQHGPAPALEPVALHLATRAGDAASPRVERWRRIHQVARALAGAPA